MISLRSRGLTARSMSEVNPSAPLVVYVDDERPNRIVFEQNLKTEFRIKTVPDAQAALELLGQEEVAVLVSDIRMPEVGGLELLRIAKELHPATLRMVITAYSDIDPILAAISEGLVARYIIKPFERDELMQVLRWATELWSLGTQSSELLRRTLENERLASLGALTASYVHDLRTPLMGAAAALDELRALAEAAPMLRAALEQSPIELQVKARLLQQLDGTPELVAEANAATSTMTGMIGALHDFIKPQKAPREHPAIDPVPVIRHTLAMYQRLTKYERVHIQYHGPEQLLPVRMQPAALAQVLLNLVGNAAQAVLARSEPNGRVDIDARPAGDMLELQIRDEGIGMPPEVLRRIGTPFYTTREEGTGLGVANCQRLLGSAGGRIKFESEQGVGTIVTLRLPLAS